MLIKMWKPDLQEFLNKVNESDNYPLDCEDFINKLELFLETPLSGDIYFDYEDLVWYNTLKHTISADLIFMERK